MTGRTRGPELRATTILAVRHKGRVVMAGDGQVTIGQTIMKSNARKLLPGPRACRLRRRRRRRADPLRALRGEAPAGARQPPARRGRAGAGLADGPAAA